MGQRHRKSPYRFALFLSSVTLLVFITNIQWSIRRQDTFSPQSNRLQTFKGGTSFDLDIDIDIDIALDPAPNAKTQYLPTTSLHRQKNYAKNDNTLVPTGVQTLVQPNDSIYAHIHKNSTLWDFSPIVLEDYELVFFALPPATVWKRLFRRMMGYQDWNSAEQVNLHDPSLNGLKYLRDFNLTQANAIMTSPKYTRAIFVRDPLEKFYAVFHETVLQHDGEYVRLQCCSEKRDCFANVTPEAFLNLVDQTHCSSPQWSSIAERMESKYWKYINFVGHWDHVDTDSQDLLQRLGVWNLFGASGWGKNGQLSLSSHLMNVYQPRRRWQRIKPFYEDPLRQVMVNHIYRQDYDMSVFGFSRYQLVQSMDYIYKKDLGQWDASPVVVEKFKLIFFTVPKNACTTWKMLFRRISGALNYQDQDERRGLPHDPTRNGLRYLWHYSLDDANRIMTSPDYTRAIFVRDPKERFLSAYLDKAVALPDFLRRKCCRNVTMTTVSVSNAVVCSGQVPTPFQFLDLIQECKDGHWVQQHFRMEEKYWPFINFVGRHENVEEDAKRLLKQIGAWEEYGSHGWGTNYQDPIFFKGSNQQQVHTTNSREKYGHYFTPELERKVEQFYAVDYNNTILGFQRRFR